MDIDNGSGVDSRIGDIRSHQKFATAVSVALREHVRRLTSSGLSGEIVDDALRLEEFVRDEIRRSAQVHPLGPDADAFYAWMKAQWDRTDKVKVLCGVRGSGKSLFFADAFVRLQEEGVDLGDLVYINFEDARFRRLKTSANVLAYLDGMKGGDRVRHLYLDGFSAFYDYKDLIDRLLATRRWNIWMTCSSAKCVAMLGRRAIVRRQWTNLDRRRDAETLTRIWHTIFSRDLAYGLRHIDIRSHSMLLEHLSDHMGDELTTRGISRDLQERGVTISPNSVKTYIKSIVDAYLIEAVPCWDLFEGCVVKPGFKVFATDLEIRFHRFGPSSDNEAERMHLARLYLQLRQEYDNVYYSREPKIPFVTVTKEKGVECWSYDISEENRNIVIKKRVLPPPRQLFAP